MPRTKRQTKKAPTGPAAYFVALVERAAAAGSPLADNCTELGTESTLLSLRTALPFAAPIAHGADRLNFVDPLVEQATASLEKAHRAMFPDLLACDDDDSVQAETSAYFLGLLVGIEIGSGIRGGGR